MADKEVYKELRYISRLIEKHIKTESTPHLPLHTTPLKIYVEQKKYETFTFVYNEGDRFLTTHAPHNHPNVDKHDNIGIRINFPPTPDYGFGTELLCKHYENGSKLYKYSILLFSWTIFTRHNIEVARENPKLNTKDSSYNYKVYTDLSRRICVYFGYADDDKALPENNMFVEGNDKGVFFIINDKVHGRVKQYINSLGENADVKFVVSIADGCIDVYKSKHLTNVEILTI